MLIKENLRELKEEAIEDYVEFLKSTIDVNFEDINL